MILDRRHLDFCPLAILAHRDRLACHQGAALGRALPDSDRRADPPSIDVARRPRPGGRRRQVHDVEDQRGALRVKVAVENPRPVDSSGSFKPAVQRMPFARSRA